MLARICTEDTNSERTRELCQKYLEGFTLLRGMGVWKDQLEPALVIEVAHFGQVNKTEFKDKIVRLAKAIKDMNQQEAVLIEFFESVNILV